MAILKQDEVGDELLAGPMDQLGANADFIRFHDILPFELRYEFPGFLKDESFEDHFRLGYGRASKPGVLEEQNCIAGSYTWRFQPQSFQNPIVFSTECWDRGGSNVDLVISGSRKVHTQERISEIRDRVNAAADKVDARSPEAFIGTLEGEDLVLVS